MSANESGSSGGDLLGTKAVGEAVKEATKRSFDILENYLNAICLPAAQELGLTLRDSVAAYRATNLQRIAEAAERRVAADSGLQAFPVVAPTLADRH